MEAAKVLENIFPKWDIGAPSPTLLADEHQVNLAYYTEESDVALVTFAHCFEYRMGMPDENLVSRHPLGKKGLQEYEAHLIENSEWINQLERDYKIISAYSYDGRKYQHYIFTFHDRSFECIASGYKIQIMTDTTIAQVLKNLL
jgi:hypothetical protein